MNRKMMITAASLALVSGLGTTAASCDKKGTGDAPVSSINGHRAGDDSPADVTNFPDHFANIATKCIYGAPGYRAFITTRNAPPVVLPDPACKG